MSTNLATIWFYLLGFILALYIMLDGFDLGVGILSLFIRGKEQHALMISSVSTVWDANETWLVIWGGALFGAFPVAYATALSALYIPVMTLLIALIFRGVSFEFHAHANNKWVWSFAFGAGSLLAVICEAILLGGVLSGIPVDATGMYTGVAFHWINTATPLIILEVVAGFALLGATYLVMKTEGAFQHTIRVIAMIVSGISFAFAIGTALVLPSVNKELAHMLLVGSHRTGVVVVLGISAVLFLLLLFSLSKGHERLPFFLSQLVFFVTFAGLWVGVYPDLLPSSVTISMAAAKSNTLLFMLIGIAPIIPIILTYNIYVYRVFRHKVSLDGATHAGY